MNYHIHLGNGTTSILALEELQRRRKDGRLTGQELVWREGMAEWQGLDFVLGIRGGLPSAPQKSSPWLVVGIVVGGLIFLGFMTISFIRAFHVAQANLRRNTQTTINSGDAGVSAASRPIAFDTKSATKEQFIKARKEFGRRQYVDAYDKLGDHSKPWDAKAKRLLDEWIDAASGGEEEIDRSSLRAEASELASDPTCDDPLILLATAAAGGDYYESARRAERALELFPSSPYKAYPRFSATVKMAGVAKRTSKKMTQAGLDRAALGLFKECLSDGSLLAGDQPDLAQKLLTGWGAAFFKRNSASLISAADDAGPAFRWLAQVLRGEDEINQAWVVRGSGWARSVTPESWTKFNGHIAKARAALTGAWNLHPEWPQAPARMEIVAMAGSNVEETRQWFDRATAAQIDNTEAWRDMFWALRPRWQGSAEAIKALGVAAVNSGRFDTTVPRQYLNSIDNIEEDADALPGQHIYGRTDIWPDMQRMYEGYVRQSSDPKDADPWREQFAIVAYFARHYDVAREQLEHAGWQMPLNKLEGWGADISLLPLEAAARTGSASREVNQAEEARDQDRVDEALRIYRKISTVNTDERTGEFVQHRLASLQIEQQLQGGQWVDFLPTATNDLNWITLRGTWSVMPDGSVEVHSGPDGSILFSRARVGVEYEIKGEFEVAQSSTKDFQAGVVMGMPSLKYSDWYAFRMKHNTREGDAIAFTRGMVQTVPASRAPLGEQRNTFDFRLGHDNKANATVNDKIILAQARRPASIRVCDNQFLVGLGNYNDMNETVIRYSKVQVRRLSK